MSVRTSFKVISASMQIRASAISVIPLAIPALSATVQITSGMSMAPTVATAMQVPVATVEEL